ncbi:MAG: serine hydrolase domain-containing protein [Agriterribacter sp.]
MALLKEIHWVLFAVVLTVKGSILHAQEFDRSKLDAYFSALEENHKFMGSIAAAKDGKIVYQRALGYADIALSKKADTHTKYRIGSISKTFTATLVMKAVETGRLELSQTISKWFPSVKNADEITIQQLLNHSSGIHNFTNNADYMTWNTQPKSEAEMLELIAKGGSDFEQGTKSAYSNSNYVLLTFILEKTFKKLFGEILKTQIIQPLALNNTYVGSKINVNNNEARSYQWEGSWKPEKETDLSIPLGAGSIVSTPADLVLFASALFNGKIIKTENVEKMKTITNGYGLGLVSFPFYDKTCYGHTGGIDGFRSVLSYIYDGNTVYALTVNGVNINPNDISIAVLSALYNKPYNIPAYKTYAVNEKELEQYVGVYASDQVPLKISITKNGAVLSGQVTGQPPFPLEATDKHTFKFEEAGVEMIFDPQNKTMLLKQGGGQFNFKKEQ